MNIRDPNPEEHSLINGRKKTTTVSKRRSHFVPLEMVILPPRKKPDQHKMLVKKGNTSQKARTNKVEVNLANDSLKIPVGGRLFRFRAAWKGANYESVVKKGLSWHWEETPPPVKILHQEPPPDADKTLIKLRRIRVIEKAKIVYFQSRIFSVPKKDSHEGRLILDLSILNSFIRCPTFKMLTLREIKMLLGKGLWTTSLGFKDGYWHLPICPSRRPFLSFRWRNQNWQFRAMPFGLNIGPRIFTKVVAHAVKVMAKAGIWCLPYLDDLLIVATSEQECKLMTEKAIGILISLGWILNTEKSRLIPAQEFTWLGVHFDLRVPSARTPTETMESFQHQLRQLIMAQYVSVREIMKLQGLANWISLQDPIVKLILPRTRRIIKSLKKLGLDTPVRLSMSTKLSICRWIKGPTIPQSLGAPPPDIIIQTDACLDGWGFQKNDRRFSGRFDKSMSYSINVLETLTVWYALLTVKEKGVSIHVLTDNSSAIAAVRKNVSLTTHLSSLSELIWRRAVLLGWNLHISHIQGCFNIVADQLSRRTTVSTEWSLAPKDFRRILKLNPYLQVDLFATNLNNHLPAYISPCPDQRAVAVDALTTPWDKWKHLYLFPPTAMISRVLAKLTESNFESAVLITPDTPTRPWFMSLKLRKIPSIPMEVRLQQIVVDDLVIQNQASRIRVWKLLRKH